MVKVQYISPAVLKLNKRNPRKNNAAVDTVAKSIQAYGFKSPIIAGAVIVKEESDEDLAEV